MAERANECSALDRMEAEEEKRLLEEHEETIALDEELEHDENTEWLRGCGWPKWFANRPLHLIAAASTSPSFDVMKDLQMGTWHGLECVSPAASERVLRKLLQATHKVFVRCEETLAQTPRVLRSWLRSWTPSFLPYPFELPQREKTKRKYYSYGQRFLCYIFRIQRLARNLREKTYDISGLQLSSQQVAMMDYIWAGLSDLVREADSTSVSQDIPPVLLENLFQLLVMFWTDLSRDGNMEQNAIVHFSGVLGIHPYELAYRRAYDYTPYLSALIWVGRLVILEYTLPLRSYSLLRTPWPDRASYGDQVKRLRDQIRPKYLQRGSLSPIGYLIERLQHGRAIARHEGARTNISWSLDGQTLGIANSQITMHQFRKTIHYAITRAQQQVEDLLFGWWPEVELELIKDNLSTHRPGYSVLTNPANKLQTSFRVLSRRAFSGEGGFSLKGAGRTKAIDYLRGRDRLVRYIYAAIHLTSGMPARGEELRVIRWADTAAVARNIFIYRGQIILVFSYNKANTNRNNSFFIVRAPCPVVQKILFVYLAQIAISIAKKHLPPLIKPFDPNTPKDYDGFLRLLSFQSGHKPLTHAGTYALEREFPAKLQPDLIDRYLENSRMWHQFALIGDSDVISTDVDCNFNHLSQSYEALGYDPDRLRTPTPDHTVDTVVISDDDPNTDNDTDNEEVEDNDLPVLKEDM
ncbi:hypothetical protein H2199_009087 [Coniosporium tulheliwenetii]|uniref:Uncharacterized protein n=1 Tax=Coniosporium tulheliwenetii TaxID=3383036 RepID=A0ACC2YFV8_9PEZI|nr:hypothetical protein H2199_009087 [Cladosporium sp. JES 115]